MRFALLLVFLLTPAAFAQQPESRPAVAKSALSLDALLAQFKQVPGLFARFEEKKYMALLAKPLVNSGTLHFVRDGRVARHVTQPSVSTASTDCRSTSRYCSTSRDPWSSGSRSPPKARCASSTR